MIHPLYNSLADLEEITERSQPSIHYKASGIHIDYKFPKSLDGTMLDESTELYSPEHSIGMSYVSYSSRESFDTLRRPVDKIDYCLKDATTDDLRFCRDYEHKRCNCYQMYMEFLKVPLRTRKILIHLL